MHSEVKIDEFRDLLSRARSAEADRSDYHRQEAKSLSTDEPGDGGDRAVLSNIASGEQQLADRSYNRIEAIEDAMHRLDEGTYGECSECGEEIALARLRAKPEAATCIRCAEKAAHAREHRQETTL